MKRTPPTIAIESVHLNPDPACLWRFELRGFEVETGEEFTRFYPDRSFEKDPRFDLANAQRQDQLCAV